jgi:hypothetical protein
MFPENHAKTNAGVGIGVILQLTGFVLTQTADTVGILAGAVLILISLPVFIWGCMNYAKGKGHSSWIGLVGLAGIIGLIVLILLPDQQKHGPIDRLQLPKLVGLISMVVGFGLALLGLWLDQPLAVSDRLDPLPAVSMVVGAFVVVGSVLLMVRNGRR